MLVVHKVNAEPRSSHLHLSPISVRGTPTSGTKRHRFDPLDHLRHLRHLLKLSRSVFTTPNGAGNGNYASLINCIVLSKNIANVLKKGVEVGELFWRSFAAGQFDKVEARKIRKRYLHRVRYGKIGSYLGNNGAALLL
jgi:hypothetical protein